MGVEVKATEKPTRKFDYRKCKIPILVSVVLIVAMLVSLLVIVPLAFSDGFVSVSFKPYFYSGPGHPTLEIVYFNGSIVPVTEMGIQINVTNSYFVPVQIRYNGFAYVMLIYNHTVTDPTDVVKNKDHLIWGAFDAYSPSWKTASALSDPESYNYYVSRKGLLNYTKAISVGTLKCTKFLYSGVGLPHWIGQDLHGCPVSPGTYYIYCIAYGKVAKLFNLTVTSILWTK